MTPTPTLTRTPTVTPPILPGPQITFFGLTTSDTTVLTPNDTDLQGRPIYIRTGGIHFFIVVEARKGPLGNSADPGTMGIFQGTALPNASARSDFQLEVTNNLGNGSSAVCDLGPAPAPLGGVPGIHPPSFDPTSQTITDAINDLACRFEKHTDQFPCTTDVEGRPGFVDPTCVPPFLPGQSSCVQFCNRFSVDSTLQFPPGDTLLTVQLRDTNGNLGYPQQLIVRVP